MTVSATPRIAGPYNGNGATTAFPFSFKVLAKQDIAAILTNTAGAAETLTLDSHYSVELNPDQDANPGGTVIYPLTGTPLASGATLTMIGALTADQSTDLTNVGRYLPQVIENALDKCTILIQQLLEVSGRTLQSAVGTTVKLVFPAPSPGRFIRWRTDSLGFENAEGGTDSMALQGLLADNTVSTRGAGMVGFKNSTVWLTLEAVQADIEANEAAIEGHGEAIEANQQAIGAHFKAGYVVGGRFVGALTEAVEEVERAKLTTETVRIYNATQKHLVLTDGTRDVVISMTADGGARITAYVGTADENSLTIPRLSAVPVVQGNRENNAALQSSLRALESLGLIKDKSQ